MLADTRVLYGDAVCVCFNGGKEATILAWLAQLLACNAFTFVHIRENNEFPEISSFLTNFKKLFGFHLHSVDGPFHAATDELIARFGILAFVIGTRRTDPRAKNIHTFERSTKGWGNAPFMRVHPLLEWTYRDVWDFFDTTNTPYCSLYTRGYTSIGNATNTKPNPNLLREDGSYAHAKQLENEEDERMGR